MPTSGRGSYWSRYLATDFAFADFPPAWRVLDVGFGDGAQIAALESAGCRALGVEYDAVQVQSAAARGHAVCRAQAERLPFMSGSIDGLICKVVIPYTDEAVAISEIARVLRPGGIARLCCHGLGYSLRYLVAAQNWKRRVYAARVILNTALYRPFGRRLPGFLGDTIFQSSGRLKKYYAMLNLELLDERPPVRFGGAPVFLYHVVRRRSV